MLSKEQKIEAYTWVIGELSNELSSDAVTYQGGMCAYLVKWLRAFTGNEKIITDDLKEYFPEFTKIVSVNRFLYLLNGIGHIRRMKLLVQIIETL